MDEGNPDALHNGDEVGMHRIKVVPSKTAKRKGKKSTAVPRFIKVKKYSREE